MNKARTVEMTTAAAGVRSEREDSPYLTAQAREPILLTYKELAEKIEFSYKRVRTLAANGRLNEHGLCYVLGEPRVDWTIFQRTSLNLRRTHRRGGKRNLAK